MTEDKPLKSVVDWLAVEMHFRAGVRSLEAIGKEYGITKGRISQVAKRDKWTRDLKAKIQAKADAKVESLAARERLNTAQLNDPAKQAEKRLAEHDVVEAVADQQVAVRLGQRKDIGRASGLFRALMSELEMETADLQLFKDLGQLLDTSGPDQTGTWRKDRINELYQKVITSHSRIDGAKKLTEMLEKLVRLERQAFGIADTEDDKDGADQVLKSLGAKLRAHSGH